MVRVHLAAHRQVGLDRRPVGLDLLRARGDQRVSTGAPVAAALYLMETVVILLAAWFVSPNTVVMFLILIAFTAVRSEKLPAS